MEENQDETLGEELDLDFELDSPEQAEAPDKKDKIIKSLVARAKKAEQELKTVKAARVPKTEESRSSLDDEIVDLRLDGYSKDEVAFIMKNGGRKALEDKTSYVSIAVNTIREQKRAEAAANAVEDTSHLSEVERKYSPEQLANMSKEDLEKILPHA